MANAPSLFPSPRWGEGGGEGFIRIIRFRLNPMKKLQPGDEVVKVDEELGIAWILLPPDESLGGFRGISPRIMDEEKFNAAKTKSEEGKE